MIDLGGIANLKTQETKQKGIKENTLDLLGVNCIPQSKQGVSINEAAKACKDYIRLRSLNKSMKDKKHLKNLPHTLTLESIQYLRWPIQLLI